MKFQNECDPVFQSIAHFYRFSHAKHIVHRLAGYEVKLEFQAEIWVNGQSEDYDLG